MAAGAVISVKIVADNELSKELEAIGVQITKFSEKAVKASDTVQTTMKTAATKTTAAFKEMGAEATQSFRIVNAAAREAGAGIRSAGRDAANFGREVETAEHKARGLKATLHGIASMAPLLGPAVLEGLRGGLKQTLNYDTVVASMHAAGISQGEISGAQVHARALSTGKYKAVSQAEVLQDYLEARSAATSETTDPTTGKVTKKVASPEDLRAITDMLAQARQAMKTTGLNPEEVGLYVKSAESLGLNTPELLRSYIDNQLKAIQVLGHTVDPEQQRTVIQNAGLAAATLDPQFRDKYLQSYVQEVGATKAGSGLGAAFRTIIGHHMTKASAEEFKKYGLIQGAIRSGGGNSVILEKGFDNEDLFQRNAAEWIWDLKKRLIAKGLTTFEEREKEYFKMFGKIGAQDFAGKFDQQEEAFRKHAQLYDAAAGLSAANIANPSLRLEEAKVQAENASIETAKPAVDDLGKAAENTAGALGGLANKINGFVGNGPLGHVASDVAVGGSALFGGYMTAKLFGGLLGVGGSAGKGGPLAALLRVFGIGKGAKVPKPTAAEAAEIDAATAEVAGGAEGVGTVAAAAGAAEVGTGGLATPAILMALGLGGLWAFIHQSKKKHDAQFAALKKQFAAAPQTLDRQDLQMLDSYLTQEQQADLTSKALNQYHPIKQVRRRNNETSAEFKARVAEAEAEHAKDVQRVKMAEADLKAVSALRQEVQAALHGKLPQPSRPGQPPAAPQPPVKVSVAPVQVSGRAQVDTTIHLEASPELRRAIQFQDKVDSKVPLNLSSNPQDRPKSSIRH